MEDLTDIIEGMFIDIAEEGIGTTFGLALMWGMFFCGAFAAFYALIILLSSTI